MADLPLEGFCLDADPVNAESSEPEQETKDEEEEPFYCTNCGDWTDYACEECHRFVCGSCSGGGLLCGLPDCSSSSSSYLPPPPPAPMSIVICAQCSLGIPVECSMVGSLCMHCYLVSSHSF